MRRTVFLLAAFFLFLSAGAQRAVDKMPPALMRKAAQLHDSLTVSVSAHRSVFAGARTLRNAAPGIVVLRLPASDLLHLAADSAVLFINEVYLPKEELNSGTADLTLNGIDYAHLRLPQLVGNGLHASVKERLFDTTDIDLKERVEITGLEATNVTPHASLMATIIAGGGNSAPSALGAAPAAILSSASFTNLFPDPDLTLQRYSISVQNHSYGTVVESFYGNEAAAYDGQAIRLPNFLPVFSSGNSGDAASTSGIYTGIAGIANLTGNFKQAKNIITAGSTDSSGNVVLLSSRGPAYDGRVKPELVAYGEDGSSGASALASGAALLVQDAYRQANNRLPSSALVRATLVNSADDIGTAHVDYVSGYGSLNAYAAATTIRDGRYFEGSLAPAGLATYNLQVPAGIAQLTLTLSWTDPAAQPNAAKALVNDLDLLLVSTATGQTWKPWVLDPTPSLLSNAAQRKTDTLNNNEQVTLDLPAAGAYRIEVRGTRVSTANQDFAIAYQLDTASRLNWIYPNARSGLKAGLAQAIRWKGTVTGGATVEWATQGGNWRTIGTVSDLASGNLRWSVPDTTTTAVLRLRTPGGTIFLSDTFTITPSVRMRTGFNCADSFLLYWNRLPAATYRLYQLSGRYLSSFAQIPDTAAFLRKTEHPSIYYAVAPLINGREGIRSQTLNYPSEGTGCYVSGFFLDHQDGRAAYFTLQLGTLFSVTGVRLERLTDRGFMPVMVMGNPATTSLTLTDIALSQGENRFRAAVLLANGAVTYSDEVLVYYLPDRPVLLYPNPVNQNAALKIITGESGRYQVQLIDLYGRVLRQIPLNGNVTTLPANGLAKGLYLVRILDGNAPAFVQKLVVK